MAVAFTRGVVGDTRATDDLITKAAQNLGMPSASSLRDQLLPALGVQL